MRSEEYNWLRLRDETHWWFVGKRKLLLDLINRYGGNYGRLLDIGCGTGANVLAFSKLSCVVAIDKDWDAVKTTKARGVKFVVLVDTIWLPFKQGAFDITVASDVLEHIGDDVSALKEIYRVICASGLVYVTVPASRILYGSHDVALQHCRRYWKGTLLKKSTEAGFSSVIYQGCYNIIAFPAIATWRILQRILLRGVFRQSDVSIKWPKPLNQLLLMLIKIERSLKLVTISPVGVTLVFILRKSPISDRCRLV